MCVCVWKAFISFYHHFFFLVCVAGRRGGIGECSHVVLLSQLRDHCSNSQPAGPVVQSEDVMLHELCAATVNWALVVPENELESATWKVWMLPGHF